MYKKLIQTNTIVTSVQCVNKEEETMHHLVACNVNILSEDFQKRVWE